MQIDPSIKIDSTNVDAILNAYDGRPRSFVKTTAEQLDQLKSVLIARIVATFAGEERKVYRIGDGLLAAVDAKTTLDFYRKEINMPAPHIHANGMTETQRLAAIGDAKPNSTPSSSFTSRPYEGLSYQQQVSQKGYARATDALKADTTGGWREGMPVVINSPSEARKALEYLKSITSPSDWAAMMEGDRAAKEMAAKSGVGDDPDARMARYNRQFEEGR